MVGLWVSEQWTTLGRLIARRKADGERVRELAQSIAKVSSRERGAVIDATWVTVDDAAHLLGVPAKTIYRWARRAGVRRIDADGRVIVSFEDLAEVCDRLGRSPRRRLTRRAE